MKKEIKNTNKKFYENWTREQMIAELIRLNELFINSAKRAGEISKILRKIK